MNYGKDPQPERTGIPGDPRDDFGRDSLAKPVHHLLRQLPGRRAPASLAPRILAEIARRSRLVWYRRPWTDWPELLRWLSSLLLAGTVAGVLRLLESGWDNSKSTPALAAVHDVPVYFEAAGNGGRALLSAVHALPSTWLLVGGFTLVAVLAGTLGLSTAAWRLAKSAQR